MTLLQNNYTLRSKDIPLVKFSLYAEKEELFGAVKTNYKIVIDKIFCENKHLLPKNLNIGRGDIPSESQKLMHWITKRKAPKNRQFVDKVMMAIEDDNNPLKYVDITHALSLNDAFWITNDLTDDKWEKFNLYENRFDEILAYVAFTGYSRKVSGVITTPELTSGGALKKCWSNRDDGIFLLKGDDFAPSSDNRSQVTNEFYAAQVAKELEINYISYDLEEFHHRDGSKEIVCRCKLFTSDDIGYIDAYTYLKSCGFSASEEEMTSFSGQMKVARLCGEKQYADMMLFDTIIGNRDRHLGNFGMLVNNNTGELMGMAPVFDNGFSMLYGAASMDLLPENIAAYKKDLRCKYLSFDEQAQLFVQKRHLDKLKKLQNFRFIRHPLFNIAEPTLRLMEDFVKERGIRAIELYNEKQRNLSDTRARKSCQLPHSEKPTSFKNLKL